ncbi:HlyD family efflux transporter periplasmic adaptor subunit [Pantoea ananatis]|uniref:HlyD family secretion protein n=2 Tax=Pantoea ananas TaxID=553 RepID=UPI00287E023A|nr:HlyD family efflux transporter periplasmic adaptor subunit [Pantoea ananatis]MDS7722087.1 HlyD family efflux transporter periplasmic adaptor subunit [Pantoea ananatis]
MLFRAKAIEAQKHSRLGNVVLHNPLPMKLVSIFSLSFCIMIILFMRFANYTKRTTAEGVLIPESGLIRIYAPQNGVVNDLKISEGQLVDKDANLLVLNSDVKSSSTNATQESISISIKRRQESLSQEIKQTLILNSQELQEDKNELDSLIKQRLKIKEQIDFANQRLTLNKEIMQKYQFLKSKNYISSEQLEEKQEIGIYLRLQVEELNRSLINMNSEIQKLSSELEQKPILHSKQLADLQRRIDENNELLMENEIKRKIFITSPSKGEVTAISVSNGTRVDNSRPLLSLVPIDAILHAELYLPSSSVGFVRPGDTVMLRYLAYPYQRYGLQPGKIISISRTALPADEIMTFKNISDPIRQQGPFYKVTVSLSSQYIDAMGMHERLRSGMQLEADILQEKLPLYEWVIEPLRGIGKRL